ncbi:hypothetical protein KIW84_072797 [Lathyrus oleraceus]|uniref:Uncharacterized protein n=1 Tax=Pisum sativum TaxID=3888 RepID=A0A9D4VNB0_PEA|nr:hypothetical protein KIW84_072797 [Pisum sativum]
MMKASFNASNLENDGDFLHFVADASVIAFQYGNPDILCKPLVEAKKHGDDLVEAYAKFIKDFFLKTEGSTQSYNQQNLKNTAITENSADRSWWFQVCTEVTYFQVAPSNDSNDKNCTSPDAVHKVRQKIIEHMDLWLSSVSQSAVAVTSVQQAGVQSSGTASSDMAANTTNPNSASAWAEHDAGDGKRYHYNKTTRQSLKKPLELMSPLERADASTV